MLEPVFSVASAVSTIHKEKPKESIDVKRVIQMLETIISHEEKEIRKNQVEFAKMKFPGKIYSWLLLVALLFVPTALTLLFVFALRVTDLLLR
jgi:16S rRNA A1518/A1519 N6-dimethyltransferase RsmA/KsgA/DIM1 with predicted DNA glycosylase/AP lyase activity